MKNFKIKGWKEIITESKLSFDYNSQEGSDLFDWLSADGHNTKESLKADHGKDKNKMFKKLLNELKKDREWNLDGNLVKMYDDKELLQGLKQAYDELD